jgi:ketosteroid isomerase-like protein
MDDPEKIALAFVDAINAGDLAAIRALMTDGHTFTDAKDLSYSGANMMIGGWKHFLHAFPEYRITLQQTFADANRVALFGYAEGSWRVDGTVLPQRWRVAAAWLAEVVSDKIDHWTVFCDTAWATPPPADDVL